jgi:hypothetical protein
VKVALGNADAEQFRAVGECHRNHFELQHCKQWLSSTEREELHGYECTNFCPSELGCILILMSPLSTHVKFEVRNTQTQRYRDIEI